MRETSPHHRQEIHNSGSRIPDDFPFAPIGFSSHPEKVEKTISQSLSIVVTPAVRGYAVEKCSPPTSVQHSPPFRGPG